MFEENIIQKFRLKNIDETRNYFFKKIEQNELMIKKTNKVCTTLNYNKPFLILASTITGCISIAAFAFLLGIPLGITSSAIKLNIKKYKPIIKKKKKKHDKTILFATSKLNSREVWILMVLIDPHISHDKFVLISNVLYNVLCANVHMAIWKKKQKN